MMTHGNGARSDEEEASRGRIPFRCQSASERKETMKDRMVIGKGDSMKHIMMSDAGVCIGPVGILRADVRERWRETESRTGRRVGMFVHDGCEYGIVPKGDGSFVCIVPAESGALIDEDREEALKESTRIVAWSGVMMGIVLRPGRYGSRIEFTTGIDTMEKQSSNPLL